MFFPKKQHEFHHTSSNSKNVRKKKVPGTLRVISHGSQDKFPHVTYSTYCHTFESPKSSPRLPSEKSLPKITWSAQVLWWPLFFQKIRQFSALPPPRRRWDTPSPRPPSCPCSGLEYENQRRGRNHGKKTWKNSFTHVKTCKTVFFKQVLTCFYMFHWNLSWFMMVQEKELRLKLAETSIRILKFPLKSMVSSKAPISQETGWLIELPTFCSSLSSSSLASCIGCSGGCKRRVT